MNAWNLSKNDFWCGVHQLYCILWQDWQQRGFYQLQRAHQITNRVEPRRRVATKRTGGSQQRFLLLELYYELSMPSAIAARARSVFEQFFLDIIILRDWLIDITMANGGGPHFGKRPTTASMRAQVRVALVWYCGAAASVSSSRHFLWDPLRLESSTIITSLWDHSFCSRSHPANRFRGQSCHQIDIAYQHPRSREVQARRMGTLNDFVMAE